MSDQTASAMEAHKRAVLDSLENLKRVSSASQEQLEIQVQGNVRAYVEFAFKNSPWWRDRLGVDFLSRSKNLNLSEFMHAIPILTKSQVQESSRWMKIWARGSNVNQYMTHSTSGSTGQPVQVLKFLPVYRNWLESIHLLHGSWHNADHAAHTVQLRQGGDTALRRRSDGIAFVLGMTGLTSRINVSTLTPDQILDQLEELQPKYLSVNGFLAGVLANHQLANPKRQLKLEAVLTFADPIGPELRKITQEAFGAKVIDRYSSEEFGYLAMECASEHHLHALQLNNFIEIVDDQGLPCEVGQVGRVLVTSLSNLAMPLIRYEIGDLARWLEPCKHGISLPVLDPVITRSRDSMTDSDGVVFVPATGKLEFINYKEVSDFQIALYDDGIAIAVIEREPLTEAQIEQIKLDMNKMFHSQLPVQVLVSSGPSWLGTWKRRPYYRVVGPLPEKVGKQDFLDLTRASATRPR